MWEFVIPKDNGAAVNSSTGCRLCTAPATPQKKESREPTGAGGEAVCAFLCLVRPVYSTASSCSSSIPAITLSLWSSNHLAHNCKCSISMTYDADADTSPLQLLRSTECDQKRRAFYATIVCTRPLYSRSSRDREEVELSESV